MKLVYIANLRLPTEKAYGIQIAKTCEAMAGLGLPVVLLCPFRMSKIKDDFFEYYGIKKIFVFKKIPIFDFYLPGVLNKVAFGVKSFYSAIVLVFYALVEGADIFYTRDELAAYILSFFKKNIVFEGHRFSNKRKVFYSRFKKNNLKIVVISQGLKDDFESFGIKGINLLVSRDGVDLSLFNIKTTKEEVRKKYQLPLDKKIVMYSGHLFEWKGVNIILKAARQLLVSNSEFKNVLFVFVGGTDYDVNKFKDKAGGLDNVLVLGHKPYNQIPMLLKTADILVLPNSAKEEISKKYTSPLKLFEYMACGRPIIASDLISIREVLNDKNSYFFKADDHASFVEILKNVLNDTIGSEEKVNFALGDVQQYTWQKRVEKILDFIGS